jgi:hypothetical protein
VTPALPPRPRPEMTPAKARTIARGYAALADQLEAAGASAKFERAEAQRWLDFAITLDDRNGSG